MRQYRQCQIGRREDYEVSKQMDLLVGVATAACKAKRIVVTVFLPALYIFARVIIVAVFAVRNQLKDVSDVLAMHSVGDQFP